MPFPQPVTIPPGFGVAGPRMISVGGLILGATDSQGVIWKVTSMKGWASPNVTLQLLQRARAHGATASESFFKPRVLEVSGTIRAPSLAALDDAVDRLSTAVALGDTDFIVSEVGRSRHCSVRRSGEVIVDYVTDTLAKYSIIVTAKDPRKYGDLATFTTALPSSSGGRTYPATYPITYTGVSTSGLVRVTNSGNMPAPVWFRVDGPIAAGGWSITHVQKQLTFSSSVALNSGDYVTVDMDRREVLAQGQSPRSGWVTSRGWFSLDPGPNDISFGAANYSASALLTIQSMSAWS